MREIIKNISAIQAVGTYSFFLEIAGHGAFECYEVVRVVPKKRLVCRGRFNDREVYAKLFFGKTAEHYALRDKTGAQYLIDAKIKTPSLLFAQELDDSTYILIYEAIESSENAEEALRHLDKKSRYSLMQALLQTVAHHHQSGLLQTDLYFKNFLVQKTGHGDLIYTLDGDGIRHLSSKFKKRQKLNNLATLFSKMDVLDDDWIALLYAQYCLQLGMEITTKTEAFIYKLTQKIRFQVANGYAEKKVFRNCTDVKVAQSIWRFEALASDFVVDHQTLSSLDQFLVDAKLNVKNGNTCTVGKTIIANQAVIIKRYNIKSFWHGLSRAFRISRAAKSWANAHRLIICNIATPKPLALVEERFGWLRHRAYYLSAYVDAPDALQFFAQCSNLEEKQVVARNLALLFYKLYLLKLSHGDCKATNIKIVDLVPVLIDLDGMQAYSAGLFNRWFERKHIKDIKRLMNNWINDVEVTALMKREFLLQYKQGSLDVHDSILFRAGMV